MIWPPYILAASYSSPSAIEEEDASGEGGEAKVHTRWKTPREPSILRPVEEGCTGDAIFRQLLWDLRMDPKLL